MSHHPPPSLRIAYLDDSEVQLREVERVLSEAGHHVNATSHVATLRGQLHDVDLVIIDFHMPDLNGIEAMERLRRDVRRGDVVLFYLYTSDHEVARSFKNHGFDGAFTAKGDTDALVSQVAAAQRMIKLKRFRNDREGH